jgi:hypothetical protein
MGSDHRSTRRYPLRRTQPPHRPARFRRKGQPATDQSPRSERLDASRRVLLRVGDEQVKREARIPGGRGQQGSSQKPIDERTLFQPSCQRRGRLNRQTLIATGASCWRWWILGCRRERSGTWISRRRFRDAYCYGLRETRPVTRTPGSRTAGSSARQPRTSSPGSRRTPSH